MRFFHFAASFRSVRLCFGSGSDDGGSGSFTYTYSHLLACSFVQLPSGLHTHTARFYFRLPVLFRAVFLFEFCMFFFLCLTLFCVSAYFFLPLNLQCPFARRNFNLCCFFYSNCVFFLLLVLVHFMLLGQNRYFHQFSSCRRPHTLTRCVCVCGRATCFVRWV